MRISTLAVAAGLGLAALTGAAFAGTFSDSQNRISVTAPAGWRLNDQSSAQQSYMIIGSAANECDVMAVPRAEWAQISASAAKHAGSQEITPESWTTVATNWLGSAAASANGLHGPATFVSQSLDTSGFWPSQRAEMTIADGSHLHLAHLVRPGLEIFAYCVTFSGADNMSIYDPIIRSIATPNDAALQTAAQAEEAARAAAAAGPPPPPARH